MASQAAATTRAAPSAAVRTQPDHGQRAQRPQRPRERVPIGPEGLAPAREMTPDV